MSLVGFVLYMGRSLPWFHRWLAGLSRPYCYFSGCESFFERHPFGNVAHSPYIPHYCCFLYGYCRKDPWDAQETGFKLSGTSLRMSSTTTRILTDKSKCSIVALVIQYFLPFEYWGFCMKSLLAKSLSIFHNTLLAPLTWRQWMTSWPTRRLFSLNIERSYWKLKQLWSKSRILSTEMSTSMKVTR